MATLASLAGGLPYGFSLHYALQIEGIQELLYEGKTSTAGPTGYTFTPGLVVETSSPIGERVDRKTGIGQGYDLEVKILRSSTTAALFDRPTAITKLVANLTDTEASNIRVSSTAGFSAPGTVYIGREAIDYLTIGTFSGDPAFKTLSRGEPNADWRAYDVPASSAVATWITDAPLYWRGRIARLWVYALDPYGGGLPTTFAEMAMSWNGHLADDPEPYDEGWLLAARNYVRRLADPVGTPLSGSARINLIADPEVAVDPSWRLRIMIRHTSTAAFGNDLQADLAPFTSYTTGDKARLSQVRADIKTAWDGKISGLDAYVGDLVWSAEDDEVASGGGVVRRWRAGYMGASGTAGLTVRVWMYRLSGSMPAISPVGGAMNLDAEDNPDITTVTGTPERVVTPMRVEGTAEVGSVEFVLDEGLPTDVPSAGFILFTIGGSKVIYRYDAVTTQGAVVTVSIVPRSGPSFEAFESAAIESLFGTDASVAIIYRDLGSWVDMMRRLLFSSGRAGDNHATWDSLPAGQGYDLHAVDASEFDFILDGSWVLMIGSLALADDVSFQDVFGGLLALSGRCIVPYGDGSAVELRPVRTTVYDTADTVVTIDDADLVTDGGGRSPVRHVQTVRAPNAVTVKLLNSYGDEGGAPIYVNDVHSQRSRGTDRWELEVIGADRRDVLAAVTSWAHALFADGHQARIYEIDVPLSLDVHTGDAVRLEMEHFKFWDAATGSNGYTGTARVLGREVDLVTQHQTLTVMTQGAYRAIALSPSAPIQSFTGTPGIGDLIRIPEEYLSLCNAYLASSDPFELLVYRPGWDKTTDGYTFDAVALAGGLVELTVASVIGSPTLTTDFFLTLPASADTNAAQDLHLHADTTGAVWR